ncbi:MAG TPA: PASTA domain-containing protein [Pseudothermotoga sp.]|uniref:PASTA domain-containing protein n=1 Tax=Thermotoga profunda TaxID=1508420 RepID=UPI0005970D8D|nr:PASTA domain-containing protein [Thermotoga profunda]
MRTAKNQKSSALRTVFIFLLYMFLGMVVGGVIFLSYFLIRPQTVEIPDVKGFEIDRAIEELKRSGVKPGQIFGTGLVDHTYPNAGQKVRKNRTVIIFLREPQQMTIPDLVGAPKETAVKVLTEMGFQIRIVQMPFKGTDGRVMGIYPPAGSSLKQNGEVSILVDSGEPGEGSGSEK